MKYLSVDIETTGLDESWCQILEIAVVLADTKDIVTPVSQLPHWSCRVMHKQVIGQPYALWMNAELIKEMERASKDNEFFDEHNYRYLGEVWGQLTYWIEQTGVTEKMSFSGKNYGTFDSRFLWLLPRWNREAFRARVLDPGVLFFRPDDDRLPDLKTCIERAGIIWDEKRHHKALEDARMVIELNRVGLEQLWRRP